MAKFTSTAPLNIKWNGNEIVGAAGATHRIPDALYDEFNAAFSASIPGLSWVTQDETSSVPALPIAQVDVTGLTAALAAKAALAGATFTGTVTAPTLNGVVHVTAASAIQVAINAMSATGGTIFLPPGTYDLSSALTIPGDNIRLVGAGIGATLVRWSGAGAAIANSSTSVLRSRFALTDLTINGQGGSAAGGVKLQNMGQCLIERVRFENYGGIGVEMVGTGSTYYNVVRSCWFNASISASVGVKFTAGTADPNANTIVDCTISLATGAIGINVAAGLTNLISGVNFQGPIGGTTLLTIAANANYGRVIGCWFEEGTVTLAASANWWRFVANIYANTVTFTDSGSQNVRVAEPDGHAFVAPSVKLYRSAAVSIANNSVTLVPFNLEEYDGVQSMHDNVTNNTRATIAVPGRYHVTLMGAFAANGTGQRQLRIYKNSGDVRQSVIAGNSAEYITQVVSTTLRLIVGDIIEAAVYQNSGGALDLLGGSSVGIELVVEYVGQ